MQNEIEAKYTNVNHDELREKLKVVGAELVTPMFTMRRTLFDYEDLRLDNKKAWLRVRQEADRVTMSFKQRSGLDIDSMKEVEVVVSDYESTRQILLESGLSIKAEQDQKREIWNLGECEVTLDEWPWIPTFVEIEGPSNEAVQSVSEQLGFIWGDAVFDSVDGLYLQHFDVTRTEISKAKIFFGNIPQWLEAKRK